MHDNEINERFYNIGCKVADIALLSVEVNSIKESLDLIRSDIVKLKGYEQINSCEIEDLLKDHKALELETTRKVKCIEQKLEQSGELSDQLVKNIENHEMQLNECSNNFNLLEEITSHIPIIQRDLKEKHQNAIDLVSSHQGHMMNVSIDVEKVKKQLSDQCKLVSSSQSDNDSIRHQSLVAYQRIDDLENSVKCIKLEMLKEFNLALSKLSACIDVKVEGVKSSIPVILNDPVKEKALQDIELTKLESSNAVKRSMNSDHRLNVLEKKIDGILLSLKQYDINRD